MSSLLIKNIQELISCDDRDTVYQGIDVLIKDNVIAAIGPQLNCQAERVLDGSHMLCYPGLINTHHHLYQQFSRNLPQVQNMELFDWLRTLYEIWKNIDMEVIRYSSLTGMCQPFCGSSPQLRESALRILPRSSFSILLRYASGSSFIPPSSHRTASPISAAV